MNTYPALEESRALLLWSCPLLASQSPGGEWVTFHNFSGSTAFSSYGSAVATGGDVNGDGFLDLIVGSRYGGTTGKGAAFVYSGKDGAPIFVVEGFPYPSGYAGWFGHAVAGGHDLNQDGFDDFLVGAPRSGPGFSPKGEVYAFSGKTGIELYRIVANSPTALLGESLSFAGDVNADGVVDIVAGAPGSTPAMTFSAGSALIYSGADGSLLWQFDGSNQEDWLGESVAGAGDVDGDGYDDIVVGAIGEDPNGLKDAGAIRLYSGATGSLLWRVEGSALWMGYSVDKAGDVDADGLPDVVAGEPGDGINGGTKNASVHVLRGYDGQRIRRFQLLLPEFQIGRSVAGVGDINWDGHADVAAGAPFFNPGGANHLAGGVFLYSGKDGSLFGQYDGKAYADLLGTSLANAGDVNGDGVDDVITGAPGVDPGGVQEAGAAYVFGLDPYLFLESRELSTSSGTPARCKLDFPASEAGSSYALLASASGSGPTLAGGIEIPLTSDALFQRMISGWAPPQIQGAFGVLNPYGHAQAALHGGPALAPFLGRSFHLAAVSYDRPTLTGRLSSIARVLTIAP